MCGNDYSRGPNMLTAVRVHYRSGRQETHHYKTEPAAHRDADKFMKLPTVKRATVLKKKINPHLLTKLA